MPAGCFQYDQKMLDTVNRYTNDPLGFILFIFPWGKKGTFLEDFDGPDTWQRAVCEELRLSLEKDPETVQIAVASGHGIGKTALVAMLIYWFISTRCNCQIVVTANTKNQLETKTWRELNKWHSVAQNKDWFKWTATKLVSASPDYSGTWYAQAIPWSINNSQAFAGTHEAPGKVLMIFDEASTIDDKIWEVASGALTTKGSIWCAFGNPTENSGMFYECFNKFKHRWKTMQIDSRTAKVANARLFSEWIEDHGIDSDYVKIRVLGEFPTASRRQLISRDLVEMSFGMKYEPKDYEFASKILGCDVARFGDNRSVIAFRQGKKLHEYWAYQGMDTQDLAAQISAIANMYRVDAIFVDAGGVGGGVIDRLQRLGQTPIEVHAGSRATNYESYANLRAEMWVLLKEWMKEGGSIPYDKQIMEEMVRQCYEFTKTMKLILESKKDMGDRGIGSPDIVDAIALTFAYPVYQAVPEDYYPDEDMEYAGTSSREIY